MNPAKPGRAAAASSRLSLKAEQFTESVIREMTRLALQYNAVNFRRDFPIFRPPPKSSAPRRKQSTRTSTSTPSPGARRRFAMRLPRISSARRALRSIRSAKSRSAAAPPKRMISSMMAIINPGDEVVVFEPFYENYGPDAILSGATPRFVKLHPPDWTFDPDELAAAFGPTTKAIILNTPNNPTGKVFERSELERIRDLCVRMECLCHHRRNLRAHALRRREAHLARDARRHARPHDHDQRALENL